SATPTSVAVVAPTATPPPAPPATAAPTPPTPGGAAPPSAEVPASEQATLHVIEARVAQIRGLAPKADVPLSLLDRDALRRFLLQSFDRDYPPSEREVDQRRYEALGLLQPGQDVAK